MHSTGFVDIPEYYASAALFTSFVLLLWFVLKGRHASKEYFTVWNMDHWLWEAVAPTRGLRAKISNKHEINSLPADIKGVYICTYQKFLKVLQCRLRYLTITGACKKKDPLDVAVHHRRLPSVLSSPACWHWWFLSEYLIPLSLPLCHNHCSLWSVCPLCPFKMRHVMRALEDCVSGLFSYSDKISSHIPRSLTRLRTNTAQLSTVIVCPSHKVTYWMGQLRHSKSMFFQCLLRSCQSRDWNEQLYSLYPPDK